MLKNKVECDRERCLAGISALHSMYTSYMGQGAGRGKKEAPKKIRRYANVAYYENAQWTNLIAPKRLQSGLFFLQNPVVLAAIKPRKRIKQLLIAWVTQKHSLLLGSQQGLCGEV